MTISYGSGGLAAGVTAGGNVAKGYGNGESQAWVDSYVGSKESKTEIDSGTTANIIGSQVVGKRIEVKAQDLNIESVQDTMKYEGKQESASGQITVGYGVSGSANYSSSKVKANYASVNQQAGIFAGDEGYIVSDSPDVAITQGTLQLAATKMREETLANSRLFKGIKDEKTGQVLRNDSYDSGYFDGVKLGGVRIDLDVICNNGMGTCTHNEDGTVSFIGTGDKTLNDAIDPAQNKKAEVLYGQTGGFQSIQGGWYLGNIVIPYKPNSFSDILVEGFAGTHDYSGGAIA